MAQPSAGPAPRTDLRELVGTFRGKRVLVVGDAMLDVWHQGSADRLCREAPVPVVREEARTACAGGAANTAVNVARLGGRCTLVSALGDDAAGDELAALTTAAGVTNLMVRVPRRRTATKTRVLAGDRLLVRLDSGAGEPLPGPTAHRLVRLLEEALDGHDAVIVADYRDGVLGQEVGRWLRASRPRLPLLTVDAHRPRRWRELSPDLTTPNYGEVQDLLAVDVRRTGDPPLPRVDTVVAGARDLAAETGARLLAVTLDVEGAVVLGPAGAGYRVVARTAARPAGVRRTVGAGDAYTAAFTLALAGGGLPEAAAELAQAAARAATAGPGTATCDARALRAELEPLTLAPTLEHLQARLAAERSRGHRIVLTNGCFDLLHHGHVRYLADAAALGDVLVVAVNSDAGVRRLKGPDRPVNAVEDRVAVLAALAAVDHVVTFDEDTAAGLVAALRPDCYVKGGDYTEDALPEADVVRAYGGEVRVLPLVAGTSTTTTVARIRSTATEKAGGEVG